MHWYNAADSVNDKGALRYASMWNGRTAGCGASQNARSAASCRQRELTALKEYISGQVSDGWGEGFEQREIAIGPAADARRQAGS